MNLENERVKVKWGQISAQKLESERSKSFAVSLSLQTKSIRSQFRVPGTGKNPRSSENSRRSWLKSRCARGGLGYSISLKKKWGYISAQKLENERSKSFAVSISLQTKATRSQFRVPGTGKYPPSSGKSSVSWSKSRCAQGGLGHSMSLKLSVRGKFAILYNFTFLSGWINHKVIFKIKKTPRKNLISAASCCARKIVLHINYLIES